MKAKDFDKLINNILIKETKKLISEQVESDNLIDKVKTFQTISGLVNNISSVKKINNGFIININNVNDEKLLSCCGGNTVQESQKNLLQGLQYDLEESGLGDNMDLDLSINGINDNYNLKIKVTTNEDGILGNEDEMEESFPASNDEKKESAKSDKKTKGKLILGNKEIKENTEGFYGNNVNIGKRYDNYSHDFRLNAIEYVGGQDVWDLLTFDEQDQIVQDLKNEYMYNMVNENNMKKGNKKIVRLRESELVKLLKNLISESEISQPFTKPASKTRVEKAPSQNIPGIDVTRKAQNTSKTEGDEYIKNVKNKMKDYLSFEGNDNPEFPKQIGKGDKVARHNNEEQDQIVADNRGRGPQDLIYDNDFGEKQQKRIEKALTGDSTMGNDQDDENSNVVKTDTGEKMLKNIKRRQEIKKNEPLYNKEDVPVNTVKKKINEDIEKMKNLIGYNEKTQ